MSIRSGLAGQVGIAVETTYGTPVTPSVFLEPLEAVAIRDTSTWEIGGGVAAGRLQKLTSRRRRTAYGAAGTLPLEVTNRGMGKLLRALMGTPVTPVQQGATAAYLQEHVLADPWGQFLTVQSGVPDLGGVVRPYTLTGGKITGAEFSCSVGQTLRSTFDLIGRELVESLALGTAAYPTDLAPFSWTDLTIKVGSTVAAATPVSGIRGVTCRVGRPSREDRNYAGSGGKIAEPVINDYQPVTGSLDVDFMDKTVFADRFHSGGSFGLDIDFVGPVIEGANNERFRITLDGCVLTGETPQLNGPDIVTGQVPFEWTFDGTNLPKISYVSRDVTV